MRLNFLLYTLVTAIPFLSMGQSLTGTWKITSDTEDCPPDNEGYLVQYQQKKATGTVAIVFQEDHIAIQGLFETDKEKLGKSRKFLYKEGDDEIYILDEKLKLIMSSYVILNRSATEIRLANKRRQCEEITLVRLR